MQRRSKWTASLAATGLAAVAFLGIVAFGGSSAFDAVAQSSATPTPTPSPTPSPTPAPFAFTVACAPNPTTAGTIVNCLATQAPGTGGAATQYLWNFGDNSPATAGNPVQHTYAAAGSFPIAATAFISTGGSQNATTTETITAPIGVTISGPASGSIGVPLTYTAAAAAGAVLPPDTIFTWNFGDGTPPASGPSTSHVFLTSGNYTITLTATSALAATTGTASLLVNITSQGQQLALSLTPLTATAGVPTTFTVSATSPTGSVPADVVYTINWGDNTGTNTATSASPSVSHNYANAGTFSATVTSSSASIPASNNTATFTIIVTSSQPTGPSATYGPGWNLVGGPGGTTFPQANGPMYTYQAGDTAYRSVQNTAGIQGGFGYWAYFTTTTTVALNGTGGPNLPYAGTLPAGAYVMVGNPSNTATVTVTGADVIYAYDPVSGYVATTTLKPGQGGWAYSASGGPLTMR